MHEKELEKSKARWLTWTSVVLGAGYGLFARFIMGGLMHGRVFDVMSSSFVVGVPFALGFVTVWLIGAKRRLRLRDWFIPPIWSGLLFMCGALLLLWEGLICVVVLAPLAAGLAIVGGVMAGIARLLWPGGGKIYCAAIVGALPFVAGPIEQLHEAATEVHTIETAIEIRADRGAVWRQIRSVPRIDPAELRFSFSHLLGFPRPVEARLEGIGVGAVRYATFDGGVLFVERVTEWDEDHALAFSIRADTVHIPATTFDEHVTIGGPYFDVLDGRYAIEELGDGRVRLHLTSRQRLSTRFNFYAHFWTRWLMADLQNVILRVIRERCEGAARQ